MKPWVDGWRQSNTKASTEDVHAYQNLKVSQTGILSDHDTKTGRGTKTSVQWHRAWTATLAQNALKQEACNQILT